MIQRLLATLLHYANTSPPWWDRQTFYALKERLLRRYGRLIGSEIQEIRKECWGPWGEAYGERAGCLGETCPRCRGTGVYEIKWIRLERWEWRGYTFHRPAERLTRIPDPTSVRIFGRIEHRDYGRLANEAGLWLYLLCGEWAALWKALRGSRICGWTWLPLLNVQKIAMELCMRLSWRQCLCGRTFPTWGTGRQICRQCRNTPTEPIPF